MIVIKVELWPLGDESAAREIARGKIINDGTGNIDGFVDPTIGNYDVFFYEDNQQNPILGSRVEGYWRSSSVWCLIKRALKEMY
jgi:hypothetical protein